MHEQLELTAIYNRPKPLTFACSVGTEKPSILAQTGDKKEGQVLDRRFT